MKAIVSIIMGSTSDYPVMEKAAKFFEEMEIPFEINALSAHRTPEEVEKFAKNAASKGIKVIIAGAGMAAHLPGVIAAMTPIPVIGVPIKASLDGLDSLLAIVQMPPGIANGYKAYGDKMVILANCATEPHDPNEIIRLDPFTDKIPYSWDLKHG